MNNERTETPAQELGRLTDEIDSLRLRIDADSKEAKARIADAQHIIKAFLSVLEYAAKSMEHAEGALHMAQENCGDGTACLAYDEARERLAMARRSFSETTASMKETA